MTDAGTLTAPEDLTPAHVRLSTRVVLTQGGEALRASALALGALCAAQDLTPSRTYAQAQAVLSAFRTTLPAYARLAYARVAVSVVLGLAEEAEALDV